MLRYSRFITFTFIKKFAPWIVIAVGIAAYLGITMVSISSANGNNAEYISSISTFDKFFPFLFAVLISIFGIIHVFKEGEEDGTELTIISKPLTRKQIIVSKFLMILALIVVYQIIMFVVYISASFYDSYASNSERIAYAASLFVGGLIVQTIMTSVLILLAAVLSKIGTLVVGILLAAAFPIISFSISPITGGQPFAIANFDDTKGQLVLNENGEVTVDTNTLYFEPYPRENLYGSTQINDEDNYFWNSVNKYEADSSYGAVAYFDLWYQWGRFYDIFMPQNSSSSAVVQKWSRQNVEVTATDENSINAGNEKYAILIGSNISDINTSSLDAIRFNFESWWNKPNEGQTLQDEFNALSLFGRLGALDMIYNQSSSLNPTTGLDDKLLSEHFFKNTYSQSDVIIAYSQLVNEGSSITDNAQKLADDSVMTEINKNNLDQSGRQVWDGTDLPTANLAKVGSTSYVTLVNEPWIPTYVVIIMWSVIGVALVAGATFLYFRRDFK